MFERLVSMPHWERRRCRWIALVALTIGSSIGFTFVGQAWAHGRSSRGHIRVASTRKAAANSQSSAPMTLAVGSVPMALTQSTPLSDGQVTTDWTGVGSASSITAEVTALPGSVISVTQPDATSAQLDIGPPPSLAADQSSTTYTDGKIYASASGSVCSEPFTCTKSGLEMMMDEHTPGKWYVTAKVTSSAWSWNTNPVTYSTAYTKWPGEKGDTQPEWSPTTTVKTADNTGTVSISAGWNGFGFSYSFPVNKYSTVSPNWPNDPFNIAFGAAWRGSSSSCSCNTVYEGADSANTIHLGAGQSAYPDLVTVNGHG